jgi:hypothetical protein
MAGLKLMSGAAIAVFARTGTIQFRVPWSQHVKQKFTHKYEMKIIKLFALMHT